MSIFYANHAKMNVLLQPFTPPYSVSKSSGSPPGRSSGCPASSSSSASSPRHHSDPAYRRPPSDYADSPDYAKRRREASPEQRTASMSPRPDRRRQRADNDMAIQPRAAYADPGGSGSGSGGGGGRARAASPETMARCARLGARLNRPLPLTPTSLSRSRGQAMQSAKHGDGPVIKFDPASFHCHLSSSSLPSNPFTPTSRLSRSPTPSPPSRRRDSDRSEMARAGTRPGDDGGSRYRFETVGSRHRDHDTYDHDRGAYIKSERDMGRASPPSESGSSSSSSSGGSRRRSSSSSDGGDSEDSRSKYRSIRDYAVAQPRPLPAARTATQRDGRDGRSELHGRNGRFGLDGRERFAYYGVQPPSADMSPPRSAAATESRAFWLNVGECELRVGDRRGVRRDDENQSSSQRAEMAGSDRRRSLSLRMGKHVLQYDG